MASVTIDLKGTLDIRPVANSGCGTTSTGSLYEFTNATANKVLALENGSHTGSVDNGSFVALPLHPSMRGTLLYIRVLTGSIDIQITSLVAGAKTVDAVNGVFVIEKTATDAMTGVDTKGTGSYEWAVVGNSA